MPRGGPSIAETGESLEIHPPAADPRPRAFSPSRRHYRKRRGSSRPVALTKSLEIQGGGTPGSARLDVSVFTLRLAGRARPPSRRQKCSQSWDQLGLYPRHRPRRFSCFTHHISGVPRAKISNPFSAPPSRRTGPREAGWVVGMGPAKRGRGSWASCETWSNIHRYSRREHM